MLNRPALPVYARDETLVEHAAALLPLGFGDGPMNHPT
jgi:hypothetical protein